ncbi:MULTISPECIES: H-NS histone family protein [Bradyrhizobium]|jgi:DNA-binding protein H-NS|uniref:DNA-binding protein H-NS-like C-terminal domain-containing protein n=2 Tax=Bradyrhizobium TaxID=374 RepID=A0A1Y2JCP8_BRAJP|nr:MULTISPECIES: H-NS histone family protein [Bradyrhizobium]OSJ25692.1 hypothetical protein BSZ19_37730 [Bradyrhizobium japonicum]UFW90092.1 H-NS histone family protein [Bradyrhizobium japonicum]
MRPSTFDLKSLSIDELWKLHEEVCSILSDRILLEKQGLEERLAKLSGGAQIEKPRISGRPLKANDRRKYPPVLPKYQNPNDPSETWSGRGKQPKWLVPHLKAGRKLVDFLISTNKRNATGRRKSA